MISGSGSESVAEQRNAQKKGATTSWFIRFIANRLTRKGAEKMAFLHTWKMISRSRDFKMKVYPSLGYLVVYLVVLFLNNKKISLHDITAQTTPGKIIFSACFISAV